NLAGVLWQGSGWAPKLALDLEGGTQIILAPQLESGQQVSGEQLDQAVSIIRQRIDAAGVSESEINTQGAQNIVVSIPGTPDKETLDRIESSAKLEFRPVLQVAAAAGAMEAPPAEDSTGDESGSEAPAESVEPTSGAGEGGARSAETAATPEPVAPAEDQEATDPATEPAPTPTDASDL